MLNKYFCNVNNKFLIKIHAASAIQAEHYFLNTFECACTCTAFNFEETKTETFSGWLFHLQMISLDEFTKMALEFDDSKIVLEDAMHAEMNIRNQIEELQEELEKAKLNLECTLKHNSEMQEKTGYKPQW